MATGSIPAYLVLEDGQVFEGIAAGAGGVAVGLLRVQTDGTGYERLLMDDAQAGNLLVFTSPHIGNCGCTASVDGAGGMIRAGGLVVREISRRASNYLARQSLEKWLIEQNTVGISEVDTRAVTRYLRVHGAMRGAIVHGSEGPNARTRSIEEASAALKNSDASAATGTVIV